MDQLNEILVIAGPLLVAAGLGLALLRRRRGTPGESGPQDDASSSTTTTAPDVVETGSAAPDTATTPGLEAAEAPEATPALDEPSPVAGRMARLRERLARSGSPLGTRLLAVLSRDHLAEEDWEELEETLLLADVGAGPTGELVDALRERVRVLGVRDTAAVKDLLREQLLALVDPGMDRTLHVAPTVVTDEDGAPGVQPAVVLMVGVNGTGKTTTVGKLARVLVAEGRSVLLGAADTFRAAAADQLQTWGARVGVETVRSDKDGADPASVAFETLKRGRADGVDVVLVDTAGRLQNKAGLMDELGKITRVLSRTAPIDEVLLVLDATTGQNGLMQARVFAEVAGVTGIVLTKLDGTAKGGIVVAVQRELGVPVKLVGLGEGPDDLAVFEPEAFVDGLLES